MQQNSTHPEEEEDEEEEEEEEEKEENEEWREEIGKINQMGERKLTKIAVGTR